MSIIWEKSRGGNLYQVRAAGASRRLYTNGVFHSQFNPNHPVTGSIWDLLFIPAYFFPVGHIQKVLVLGVGGGAVLQQLRYFLPQVQLVGIELCDIHLYIARRFFKVNGERITLTQADAMQWLVEYTGPRFDMIVDDLFCDLRGEAQRAVVANSRWFHQLVRHLSDDGILAMNFAQLEEFRRCGCFSNQRIAAKFCKVFSLRKHRYENVVGVFSRAMVCARQLRTRLCEIPQLDPRRKNNKLYYSIRTVKPTPNLGS